MFHWGSKERGDFSKCLFALPNKHLFSTSCLNYMLEITCNCTANDGAAKKSFSDMICWYVAFRNTLLVVMPKLFKTTKKPPK